MELLKKIFLFATTLILATVTVLLFIIFIATGNFLFLALFGVSVLISVKIIERI